MPPKWAGCDLSTWGSRSQASQVSAWGVQSAGTGCTPGREDVCLRTAVRGWQCRAVLGAEMGTRDMDCGEGRLHAEATS